MKYLYFVLIIQFFIVSCTVKDSKDNSNADSKIEENAEKINSENPNKIMEDNTDLKNKEQQIYNMEVISLLKKSKLIPETYPDSGIINVKKLRVDDLKWLTFVQLDFDESLKDFYESELVFNILLLNDSTNIYNSCVIDAVYFEDFNYLFLYENNYFFEFYSSPVGYTQYYIFNTAEQKLFTTEPLDEGFFIDTTTLNYSIKIFTAKFDKQSRDFKLKEVW